MWDDLFGLWDLPEANIGADMIDEPDILYVTNICGVQVHGPVPPIRTWWPYVDYLNGVRVNVGDFNPNECKGFLVVSNDNRRHIALNTCSTAKIRIFNILFEGEGPIQILPDGRYEVEMQDAKFRVTVEVLAESSID